MWDFVVVLVLMKCALINVLTLKVQSWGFTSGSKARNILDSFSVLSLVGVKNGIHSLLLDARLASHQATVDLPTLGLP